MVFEGMKVVLKFTVRARGSYTASTGTPSTLTVAGPSMQYTTNSNSTDAGAPGYVPRLLRRMSAPVVSAVATMSMSLYSPLESD